ncbi:MULTISPECIES: C40 family peptidase [Streptomyces]|uniref:C40 family peptidase n=1 Tax=Streptomyces TaxID=1883 RepID=UPI0004CD81B3|nr:MULTISPECIES: C40 family peptidase [Streptomyces]KOT47773.1 glycoside hydrolase [Streptomyces rimosus subsp. rimosus]
MSPNAAIPSHRKPRRSASSRALRAGVTGGIITLAVTGASMPAGAAEKPVSETQEMPTITSALSTSLAKSADTAQQMALDYELQAAQETATTQATEAATKAKADADRKAEAEKKAEQARKAKEEKAAQERASRSSERTSLRAMSASSDDAPVTGATGSTASLISFLRAQIGKSYVLGASGPSAYDCSSLVQAAYRTIGIDLPRTSQPQSTAGTQVSMSNLQVGDILYWGSAGSAYHVAVYVGNGNFIGAQNSSTGIVEKPLSYSQPTGAVRVL